MNLLWICTGGILVTLVHIIFACVCVVTVVFLPFVVQHMKLASVGLMPFGKEVR